MHHTRSNRWGRHGVLTLLVVLALVAAACGDDNKDKTSSKTTADTGTSGKGATIAVSFYDNKVIPLYIDMEAGMKAAAAKAGAKVKFTYANFDPAAQVQQIEQQVTQGVDVILVTPFDRNALLPAYEAARAAKIPIISFANKVDDKDEDLFVGRDWSEMGGLQMEAIAKHLGGKGKVAVIGGPPQIDVARRVSEGWKKVLAKNPGLELVATLTDPDMSREKGLDVANTMLAANPDIKGIACTIDQICLGAVQAIEEQSLKQDDIFVAALDADAESVKQVKSGTGMDFTIAMRGRTWGTQIIDVALKYLNGDKPANHLVETKFVTVDAKNAATLTEEDLK